MADSSTFFFDRRKEEDSKNGFRKTWLYSCPNASKQRAKFAGPIAAPLVAVRMSCHLPFNNNKGTRRRMTTDSSAHVSSQQS
jgi:hypothetical protein